MNKKIAVSVFVIVMAVGTMAFAFGGRGPDGCDRKPRQELLSQLPADKETLFHQTMREAREKAAVVGDQVQAVHEEAKNIMMAPEFDEKLFLEKTREMHALHEQKRAIMEEAIVNLAKQFTQEERETLAELIPHKRGYRGRGPAR
jgi:uncharacterized membrane protein